MSAVPSLRRRAALGDPRRAPAGARAAFLAAWLFGTGLGCASDGGAEVATTSPASAGGGEPDPACTIGSAARPLSVIDRSLVGGPSSYVPDASLRERASELRRSQRSRRSLAWSIAERVLTPVTLARALPVDPASLPAWQTWHAKDDLTRIFRRLYPELSPEEQRAGGRFSSAAIDEAWAWNDGSIEDFPEWTSERRAAYEAALEDASDIAGLGGIYRVTYSPAASRHWLESYVEVASCEDAVARGEDPGALAPEPAPVSGACASSRPTPCLTSEFPSSAVIIKASWRRADLGTGLPAYDTSAAALARRLAPDGALSWDEPDYQAEPAPGEIYTVRLPGGNVFVLTGLHIMSKELDDWFWITLWWSADASGDFGADRPASLPAPFQSYKLCTVTAFDEEDPDPAGGFAADHPGLAEALAVTHTGERGATWCSNPYIERGAGNALTNCIGCHQHGGTGLRTEDLLADGERFPGNTRLRVREFFPSDYVFGATLGDDIGAMITSTRDHFAAP